MAFLAVGKGGARGGGEWIECRCGAARGRPRKGGGGGGGAPPTGRPQADREWGVRGGGAPPGKKF